MDEAGKARSLSHSITRILTQSPFKVVQEMCWLRWVSFGNIQNPQSSVLCLKEFGKEDPQLGNVF